MRIIRRFAVCVLVVVGFGTLPASSQAATYHWWTGSTLYAGNWARDPYVHILSGVYCHQLYDNSKLIDIGARWGDDSIYGSWVRYSVDGLRSYAGSYWLKGACGNPHSINYGLNAHDNYFDA